jgi:hypothetical protein
MQNNYQDESTSVQDIPSDSWSRAGNLQVSQVQQTVDSLSQRIDSTQMGFPLDESVVAAPLLPSQFPGSIPSAHSEINPWHFWEHVLTEQAFLDPAQVLEYI